MGLTPNRFWVLIAVLGMTYTSAAQCPETGVNQAEYGGDAWNGYVYDELNDFSVSAFVGRKNQLTTFNENFASGTTDAPTSCAFPTETFSVRFRNRLTLSCGLHTFTVGSDYGVRFSIDGGNTFLINIPSGTGYATTDATVHLTGGVYDLVLEYYHNTGAQQVSFAYLAVPGDFAGTVSGDQTICNDPVDPSAFTSLAPARFCSELPASYQWEVNVDGGGWNPITGATSPVFDPPSGLAAGSYLYRRRATDGLIAVPLSSNEISVVADVPEGNETTFGTGQWLAYAYEGADNYAIDSYLGYFVEAGLDFTEPFTAVTVNGCDLPVEGFTVRFKQQVAIPTCGGYDITIDSEGGGARLYVDGTLVIDGYVSVAALTSYSANLFLDVGDHQFILEYYNDIGANSVAFALAGPVESGGGGVIGTGQTACGASYDPVAFTSIEDAEFCGGGAVTYQWERSLTGAFPGTFVGTDAPTYDESPLGPGTYYYRRGATSGVTVYSNTVLVEVTQPAGDETTYTPTAWRGYVYDGANNFLSANYRGYFDILSLDFTEDFSAVTMNGCDFPADDFSVRFRREVTLACGGYDITLTGDDLVRIYMDGTQLTNGFVTSYSGNVYMDGGPHEFHIEYYDVEGTRNVDFSIAPSGVDGAGGVIGYSQDICDGVRDPAPFQSLVDAGYCTGTHAYQWQESSSPSGPWTDIGGANASTYNPPVLAAGVYYYRREFSDGVQPAVYSNVVEVSAFTPIGDGTSFGDNEWIGYVYDNEADWSADFRGSLNRPNNFDESFCAGACEFLPNGCPVQATEFSVLFKNRVDFECGSYLITVGGDDGVRLIVDGVTVPEFDALTPHSYTTYSKVMYFDGTPDTELELYYFESAGGNRVSFSAVFLGPGDAGVIAGDQYSCTPGMDPAAFSSTEPATACPTFPAPTYQWQESLDGLGWNSISGATSDTYDPGPLSITHYYRRQATIAGYTLNSNIITVEIDPPQGDQTTYGQNQWIGYVYDAYGPAPDREPVDYRGYMIENTNFDRSFCGPYCTQAINGCDVEMEHLAIRYMNEMTLECGYYRITIGFNDGGRLFIDGDQVVGEWWFHGQYSVLETTEFLTEGTHQFIYEYLEGADGNRVSFNIEFLGAGTPALIGNLQVLCSAPYDPELIEEFVAPVFECSPDLNPDYQWQISTDEILWSDIPLANSIDYDPPAGHTFTAHYRRKDTNDIGEELISDVVTISYSSDPAPFNGSEFGTAPQWIGHVYNESNNFSTYQGSYIETMTAFDQSFCGPNCIFPLDGCDIVTNTFTVQYKTQIDLVAGEYTFTIGSEGAARLFISGEEIATPTLIVDDYSLHYPYRTRSNNTPLANGVPLELQGGTYFLTLDYFEDFNDNQVSFSYIFAPLPVTWHYFNGYYAEGSSYLEWRTASEINNSGFEVERSNDGVTFTKIGWVEGNGSTTIEHQYLFTDENPEHGWNYYRLKQIDYDEKFEYSRLIPVYVDALPQVEIYPNPFRDHIFLSRINSEETPEVTLTNILGQRSWILTQDPMQPARFNLPVRLEPGIYSARIRIGDASFTRKVIIE